MEASRSFSPNRPPVIASSPPKTAVMDAQFGLRFDAGEVVNGKKTVYLQVNSQAKNDALQKFRQKNGTHANLATAVIDENTPEDKQEEIFNKIWDEIDPQIKQRLG